jgi:AraC-like DNA-binding protein/ligand-binding sensor protein
VYFVPLSLPIFNKEGEYAMSKLNIIQRRELEPLMLKAEKIIKHYEKASNCKTFVLGSDLNSEENKFDSICSMCACGETCSDNKKCIRLHIEAINKARELGGSYIYLCPKGLFFWTSPFYSGERVAGALLSGGMKKTEKNSNRVKALAQIMLLCANQISSMSFIQKNIAYLPSVSEQQEDALNKNENISQENAFILDLERMLLASLRRGDNAEAKKIMVKLLKNLYLKVMNNFSSFRLKALELAVLLSRAMSDPKDIMDNTTLENTGRFIKKIEESSNLEEIIETLQMITERMSEKIFSFHGVRHFSALRKAERYIWDNYTRKLSLREIAAASGLSAPYFSTVFKEEMGENLSNYLNRLRVEKAAFMLLTTEIPISEVAIACGFEDQSWFSKIFKNNTGFTPGKYREVGIHAIGIADDVNTDGISA